MSQNGYGVVVVFVIGVVVVDDLCVVCMFCLSSLFYVPEASSPSSCLGGGAEAPQGISGNGINRKRCIGFCEDVR